MTFIYDVSPVPSTWDIIENIYSPPFSSEINLGSCHTGLRVSKQILSQNSFIRYTLIWYRRVENNNLCSVLGKFPHFLCVQHTKYIFLSVGNSSPSRRSYISEDMSILLSIVNSLYGVLDPTIHD